VIENRHQKPLDALPNARILRVAISGDVENLDLGMIATPLNGVRRQDASVRFNQEHGPAPNLACL
jgi:hypothetical protein